MIVKQSSIISIRKHFISQFFFFLLMLTTIFCSQAESDKLDFKLYDVYGRKVHSNDYLNVPIFFEFGACW